jgi:tetratricopeptide (TPR) repeat protein
VRKSLLRLADRGKHSVKTLHTDVAVESANHAMDRGEFLDAQKHLDEASTICANEPKLHLSSLDVSLARIILNLSRMRAGDGQSLHEHALALERALQLAEKSRSTKHQLLISTLQLQLQLTHPNPAPAVERVVTMAKRFSNPRLVAFVSLMLADFLMQGRHWRMAGGLLRGSFNKRTFLWGFAMNVRAEYLMKLGDPFTAYDYYKLATDGAKHVDNSRLYGGALRGLAMSAHLRGSKQEAADYIEAAVPLAEQYGTIGSWLKTNQAAALITGNPKYMRAAEKLRLAVAGTPNFLPA